MYPVSAPTNTRPETTDGCPSAESPVGYPNAHLSFSCGTWSGVSPAALPAWKRVLLVSAPQPFHSGLAEGSVMGGLLAHWLGMLFASPCCSLPSGRPLMKV